MEFKGNKGEWSELYTLLKLLADGEIYAADENMDKFEKLVFPILQIFREEKNFKINYLVNGSIKLVEGVTKKTICEINKKKFLDAANIVFNNMKKLSGRSLHVNRFDKKDELLSFLKEARIESIKAKSTDKSDIIIQVHDSFTGGNSTLGFSIKSMLGQKSTLFNAGPGTNFIFDIDGIKLDSLELDQINQKTYKMRNKIGERFNTIEKMGGVFKFKKVQSEILELNLRLIDGDLPEIIAYMLKARFQSSQTKIVDLIQELETKNPLNYNQSHKHPFYRYKIIKFLYDVALGMTPETIWNGDIKANGGIIVVKNNGDVLVYHTYHKSKFEEYLLNNTFLEQATTSEDEKNPGYEKTKENYPGKNIKNFKFGWLYRDKDFLKLKINLQVRFSQ